MFDDDDGNGTGADVGADGGGGLDDEGGRGGLGSDLIADGGGDGEVVGIDEGETFEGAEGAGTGEEIGEGFGTGAFGGELDGGAIGEFDEGFDLEDGGNGGADEADAAAFAEVGDGVEEGEDFNALAHGLNDGQNGGKIGTIGDGFGGGEDLETDAHGEGARVDDGDAISEGLRAKAGGVVEAAEVGGGMDGEDGAGRTGVVDGFKFAGTGGGGGRKLGECGEAFVEVITGEVDAIAEGLAAEDEEAGDDVDVVAFDEVGGDVGGAIGDEGGHRK